MIKIKIIIMIKKGKIIIYEKKKQMKKLYKSIQINVKMINK